MDRLPLELSTMIVGYVASDDSETRYDDLKNLRRMSKTFAVLALEPLYRTKFICCDTHSLGSLAIIARDPFL